MGDQILYEGRDQMEKKHNPFIKEPLKITRIEMVACRLFRGFTIKEMSKRVNLSVEVLSAAEKSNSMCSEFVKQKYLNALKIKKSEIDRIRLALSGKVNGIEIDREIPKMIREEVYKIYNYCCGDCKSESALHMHHKRKFSKGGRHELDNLELLCAACHAERHKNDREYHVLKSIAERARAL